MSLGSANDSQHLTITAPGAVDIPTGPYTVAMLYKNIANQSVQAWKAYAPDNFAKLDLYYDGDVWVSFTQWDGNLPINTPIWRWVIITKDVASEPVGVHVANYASSGAFSWTHDFTNGNKGPNDDLNRFSIGDEFGDGFRGDLALLTAFESEFSNAAIEATFLRSSLAIMSLTPQFFVHFPQAEGIGSPFMDLAGGGVETIRTGTWTASADPPGFDFSLGRTGKPKVWNGSSWVAHPAKVWNGSSWDIFPMSGYDGSEFVVSK